MQGIVKENGMEDSEATNFVINSLATSAGSVSEFAEKIGYSRASVHAWLRGASEPSKEAKAAIAKHFKLPTDDFKDSRVYYAVIDLLTGEEIKPDNLDESPEGYLLLNDAGKKKVCEYIQDLLASKRYQAKF